MRPSPPSLPFRSSRVTPRADVLEQLRRIQEHWQRQCANGRKVTPDEAALEWISANAADFRRSWETGAGPSSPPSVPL